jgi:hypothetical protein
LYLTKGGLMKMEWNVEWDEGAIQRLVQDAGRQAIEKARPAIERTECPDHHKRASLVVTGDNYEIQACCPKAAELAAKAAGLDVHHG